MKVICIRQNPGRKPQPQLGEIYDAQIIEVKNGPYFRMIQDKVLI